MKINIKLIPLLSLLAFSNLSCSDYLDKDELMDTTLSYYQIFSDVHYAPGFLYNAYNNIPNGFYQGGAMLAAATDDAVHSNSANHINLIAKTSISPSYNPDDVWSSMFQGIRKCNIFLKELDGIIAETNSIPLQDRDRLKGEALFLRAYFHFELLKRYQRIPWVDKVINPFEEDEIYSFAQREYHEMVEILEEQCDQAEELLPKTAYSDETLYGHPTAAAPAALKSRLLLYAASPLNNPENDIELWKKAETAASDFIDKYKSLHSNSLSYDKIFSQAYNKEIIFGTSWENNNNVERQNFPISYGGYGYMNPTQDLVEAFPMQNTTNDDPMKGFDENNPYAKRDFRFSQIILVNGATMQGSKVETFEGGKDGINKTNTATKTGYYMKKFVNTSLVLVNGESSRHQWPIFRYDEILLNYAEARNEVLNTPDRLVWDNFKAIRTRAGLKAFKSTGMTQERMREYIKLERRLNFAMEDHRFWDLRRWKDADKELNKTVSGMRIKREVKGLDENGNPEYLLVYEKIDVQPRIFDPKFYWYPIPRTEILKYNSAGFALKQNEGWQ